MCHTCVLGEEQIQLCEYIPNKFYFATLSKPPPTPPPHYYFFSVDEELVYEPFNDDFGPLDLAKLYHYCAKVNRLLRAGGGTCRLVHYTSRDPHKRANAAFLVACYALIYLGLCPVEAMAPFEDAGESPFKPFQDASLAPSPYVLDLTDVINGIYRAFKCHLFDFSDFDASEYEHLGKAVHGDITWVVPCKLLALCGPCAGRERGRGRGAASPACVHGLVCKAPEEYLEYFSRCGVSTVVRLNRKAYDARSFTEAGIEHVDLFFADGSAPSQEIADRFLRIIEGTRRPVAVHCKAGLGRTGSLIAAYLVKHYRMTAAEAIAWLRVCRPGSVLGRQQEWLEGVESSLWRSGDTYRKLHHGCSDKIPHHKYGVYSIRARVEQSAGHLPEAWLRGQALVCPYGSANSIGVLPLAPIMQAGRGLLQAVPENDRHNLIKGKHSRRRK